MRFHVDFLLDGDGERGSSSWLTPSQFEGRMCIDRTRGVVTYFELGLPYGSANVDINIKTARGVSADIGRIPRMELKGGDAAALLVEAEQAIPLEEARDLVARRFYPIAEVEWLDLEHALSRSRESGRPMHIIALFGSLTDESC